MKISMIEIQTCVFRHTPITHFLSSSELLRLPLRLPGVHLGERGGGGGRQGEGEGACDFDMI